MFQNLKKELYERIIDELKKPAEINKFKSDAAGLTGVDTRDNSWRMNLNDYMQQHGFSKYGSGKYASVYGNPEYPYAIKIFQKDSAYFRWLKFSLENRNNPYVPKIKGKVIRITPLVFAIRLEKLSPGGMNDEFEQEYESWLSDPNYKTSDPNLQQVFDFFEINRKLMDLHSQNYMMRGNQVVIIDPFYNWFGKYEPGKYTIDPNEVDPSIF